MDSKAKALVDLQNLEFSIQQPRKHVGGRGNNADIARLRKRVGTELLRKYESRKHTFGATTVVPVQGKTCSGCWISLSQQTCRHAHDHLTECEHCARLVYDPSKKQRLCVEII